MQPDEISQVRATGATASLISGPQLAPTQAVSRDAAASAITTAATIAAMAQFASTDAVAKSPRQLHAIVEEARALLVARHEGMRRLQAITRGLGRDAAALAAGAEIAVHAARHAAGDDVAILHHLLGDGAQGGIVPCSYWDGSGLGSQGGDKATARAGQGLAGSAGEGVLYTTTPLHAAIEAGMEEAAHFLVEYRVGTAARDASGDRALDIAVRCGNHRLATKLAVRLCRDSPLLSASLGGVRNASAMALAAAEDNLELAKLL